MIIETVGSGMVSSYGGNDTVKPVERTASSTQVQMSGQEGMNITVTERPVESLSQNGQQGTDENPQNQQGSGKQLKSAVDSANQKLKMNHRTGCEFSYHEETKRISIKVVDQDTKEVIREIPPEESLDMLQKLWELAGVLVDERR